MIVPTTDLKFILNERAGYFVFYADVADYQISGAIAIVEWCAEQFGSPEMMSDVSNITNDIQRWTYHLEIEPPSIKNRMRNVLNQMKQRNWINVFLINQEDAAAFRLVFDVQNYKDWIV